MRLAALLLSFALAAPAAPPSDAELRELRARFDRAVASFRAGKSGDAKAGFESVAAALAPAFAAGSIRPQSTDEGWVLYASSMLMQSDLWRYGARDPKAARDLEAGLAREAERLGYTDLAAAQWIAVGDIERFDLENPAAALAAYGRVATTAKEGRPVDGALLDQALQGLARTPGGPADALLQVRVEVPLTIEHVEATSLVLPHLQVYRRGEQEAAYAEFAAAHPRSFRAAHAEYARVLLPLVFGGDHVGDPAALAAAFERKYPDSLLVAVAVQQLADHYQRRGDSAAAARQRTRLVEVETRLRLPARGDKPRHP